MAEVNQGFNPIFPHEDVARFRSNAAEGGADAVYEMRHLAGFVSMQAFGILKPEARTHAAALVNGEIGAATFADKSQFGAFVNDMGYTAPRSVVVEPGSSLDYYDRVVALDTDRPQRFTKPLHGTRGKGAKLFASPEDSLEFAAARGEPYLVQTYEQSELDWRYILHRDTVQLANGEPPGWHFVFQKVRPTVTGDGLATIGDLVAAHPMMPKLSKDNYAKYHKDSLTDVPRTGEVVNILQSGAGNVSQGAYTRIPSTDELRTMDTFMAHFWHDAEKELGTTLGTICVDLGVRNVDRFMQDSDDHAELKRNIIFYEHQMPFGVIDDFPKDELSWGRADRMAPWAFPGRYAEIQIYVNFVRSVLRSGRYLREQAADSQS